MAQAWRSASVWLRAYVGLVLFSILGTAITWLTGLDPGAIPAVVGALTLLTGVATLIHSMAGSRWPFLAVFLLGAGAELAGLYTGWVFGRYEYSNRWWPTIVFPDGHRYPLLLPFAWLLVAGSGFAACRRGLAAIPAVVVGAVLATSIDAVMEPVMVEKLGYWRWVEPGPLPGGAPIQNVIGWLVTSLVAGAILSRNRPRNVEPVAVLAAYLILVGAIWGFSP